MKRVDSPERGSVEPEDVMLDLAHGQQHGVHAGQEDADHTERIVLRRALENSIKYHKIAVPCCS